MKKEVLMIKNICHEIFNPGWKEGFYLVKETMPNFRKLWKFEHENASDLPFYHQMPKAEFVRLIKREFLSDKSYRWFTVYHNNEMIGFLAARELPDLPPSYIYIQAILIGRKWRNQGIAQAMLKDFFNKMADEGYEFVTLKVHINNPPARNLYEKLGFEVGEAK